MHSSTELKCHNTYFWDGMEKYNHSSLMHGTKSKFNGTKNNKCNGTKSFNVLNVIIVPSSIIYTLDGTIEIIVVKFFLRFYGKEQFHILLYSTVTHTGLSHNMYLFTFPVKFILHSVVEIWWSVHASYLSWLHMAAFCLFCLYLNLLDCRKQCTSQILRL